MLPGLAGRAVADLGCGYGWFCRWPANQQARRVVGFDLSERMLERARRDSPGMAIGYERADLDELRLPRASFDVVYSSLAFHYVVALDRLMGEIADALVPGGSLVFAVEHPTFTAPSAAGFVTLDDGRVVWPLDRYLHEGERVTDWLAPGVVKRHRTIETYLRLVRNVGLVLDELIEWGPTAAQIEQTPAWAHEVDRPPFLLVAASRPE